MNGLSILILKTLRKLLAHEPASHNRIIPVCEQNPEIASQMIVNVLGSKEPCMIARLGSTETNCLCNYIGITSQRNEYFDFIRGKTYAWWWEKNIMNHMQEWSGFFPPDQEHLERFCELMLRDIPNVDILGSWLPQEKVFDNELMNAHKVYLLLLEPFWSKTPWTHILKGKKVLVVHPFENSIKNQYKKRELLFSKDILPEFELQTLKAVQSLAGVKTDFKDWFEALEFMKDEIDKIDYDIGLIGAGAYGFPLAAHMKRRGKKGFHIGGSLQLLFGIRGKRWENDYSKEYDYLSLINQYWVRPDKSETPKTSSKVENGCYW